MHFESRDFGINYVVKGKVDASSFSPSSLLSD